MYNKSLYYITFTASGHEDIIEFYKKNLNLFCVLKLTFHHVKTSELSELQIYNNSTLIYSKKFNTFIIKNKKFFIIKLIISYLNHILNIFLSSLIIRKYKIESGLGLNYFCTLGLIFTKPITKIKNIIYYSADYYPTPDKGIYKYLIPLFYLIDKICLNNSTRVWFINPKQYDIRVEQNFIKKKDFNYDIVPVLIGDNSIIDIKELQLSNKITITYLGVISKVQGIDLLINSISKISKNIEIFINIIGSGPDEDYLKELTTKLSLSENVKFFGYLKDENMLKNIFLNTSLGIALYPYDKYSHMNYGDSGKIKMYLSYGVPVITTKVPYISYIIEKENCGFIVNNYSEDEFINILNKYLNLTDEEKLKMKINAINVAKKYTINAYKEILLNI